MDTSNFVNSKKFYSLKFVSLGSSSKKLDSDLKSCNACKKEFKPTSLNRHIGQSAKCKEHYGPEFEQMKKSARSKTNKANQTKNADSISKRKAEYYADHRESKRKKQVAYNEKNREDCFIFCKYLSKEYNNKHFERSG